MSQQMMQHRPLKDQLGQFGRVMALLLNRAMMYQKDHPLIVESIDNVHKIAEAIFPELSPLVFILNRGQFYVDDEPLDPRINVARIVALFKSVGIQSLSFEKELSPKELSQFLDLYSKLTKTSQADEIKKALTSRGVFNIKVNHITFKKVTEDDQVVSRNALKKMTPLIDADDKESRKKFLDALLESVLTEELSNTMSINSLMENPAAVSRNIVEADLAGARQLARPDVQEGSGLPSEGDTLAMESGRGLDAGSDVIPMSGQSGPSEGAGQGAGAAGTATDATAGGSPNPREAAEIQEGNGGAGTLVIHQLNLMQQEVERHLHGQGDVNLSDLAIAVFDMKKQLLESIQTQKTLGVAYANEAAIMDSANNLSDKIVIQLIKEEYDSGTISTQRLAMIMRRLIPDAQDLKRLMPKIKVALLASGMPMDAYLELINELQNELTGEELSRILQESSESIGIDGDELIAEFKRNPAQAAELIYLASEIRAGAGDEAALTSILVEYVEQLSGDLARDKTGDDQGKGNAHLENVVSEIESGLLHQLGRMNVDTDVLTRMEARINERMEAVLDKMRVEWLQQQQQQPGSEQEDSPKAMTVLQTLESNIGDDEELRQIFQTLREKADAGEIEENDFSRIYDEIDLQKQRLKEPVSSKQLTFSVLQSNELLFILEKEIAKVKRYQLTFSVLAFSCVKAKPIVKTAKDVLNREAVLEVALEELMQNLREVDFLGQIGKNKMMAILPMTDETGAKKALARALRILHSEPVLVRNVPVQLRVAGVATEYDHARAPDARTFAKQLSNQLMDMVTRVKSIQVIF